MSEQKMIEDFIGIFKDGKQRLGPFIELIAAFYQAESQELPSDQDLESYLWEELERIISEITPVLMQVGEVAKHKIKKVVEDELAKEPQLQTRSPGYQLLSEPVVEHLRKVCSETPEDFECFINFINSMATIFEVMCRRLLTSEEGRSASSVVQGALSMQSLLSALNEVHPGLAYSIGAGADKIFDNMLNSNKRMPEYLSLIFDGMLRGNIVPKEGRTLRQDIEGVTNLLRRLEDKEMFVKSYHGHLAQRIEQSEGLSIDLERSLIARLKEVCGASFTSMFEDMLADIPPSNTSLFGFLQRRDFVYCAVILLASLTFWRIFSDG